MPSSSKKQEMWQYLVVPPLIEQTQRREHEEKYKSEFRINYSKARTQFVRRLLAEFLGTLILVVAFGALSIQARQQRITVESTAVSGGFIVLALVHSLGPTSGAHFNPVVTVAFALRLVFPFIWIPFYFMSQFLGTLTAAFLLRSLFQTNEVHLATNAVDTEQVSIFDGLKWEIFLTFILVFVILQTATKAHIIGQQAALAVTGAIVFICLIGSKTSSTSLNPFRTLAPAIINSSSDQNKSLWIFLIGPSIGSILAVIFVGLLQGFRPETTSEMKLAQGTENNITTTATEHELLQ
ncbi:unnamed protein product [Didymodactylos carnosus]|uniref:Aquaporin n=1 Tax=Didymodactylos carnosus TaxID=1234261 RepID=A0A8S2E2J4_9BILA|nr:unnamed protein product [Didymodactylos carnosus]CAF3829426.1 unnamed protein product [Didymodactylos carnosus]